jgi:hypothetical protein
MSVIYITEVQDGPRVMSVLPLKADIRQREWHVRYVPEADLSIEHAKASNSTLT